MWEHQYLLTLGHAVAQDEAPTLGLTLALWLPIVRASGLSLAIAMDLTLALTLTPAMTLGHAVV